MDKDQRSTPDDDIAFKHTSPHEGFSQYSNWCRFGDIVFDIECVSHFRIEGKENPKLVIFFNNENPPIEVSHPNRVVDVETWHEVIVSCIKGELNAVEIFHFIDQDNEEEE